jgi:hypothetical protein
MAEQVPMPASMSRRLDKNNSARVKRIQNDGTKIENASGGAYNVRNTNTQLAQGASTDVPKPSMTAPAVPATPVAPGTQVTNAFAPGNPNAPITDGAGFDTAGGGPNTLNARFNTADPGYVLIAAMYQVNPSPELRNMLEAYHEEGTY